MKKERMAAMADNVAHGAMGRVAAEDEETSLSMVDQAIDTMIAASEIINEHLPKVKTDSVPQKAAIDEAIDLMETGVDPYLGDLVKVMQAFGG